MSTSEGPNRTESFTKELELFFEHSFDLMGIVGTDGFFKRVNPAFERVLGYSAEELCSKPLVEFMHTDDVEPTKQGIAVLAEGTPKLATINRYRCRDGSIRWFSWNTKPMGSLLYAIGRDITDQVAADERIRTLNDELKRRNENLESEIVARLNEMKKQAEQLQQLQKLDAVGRLAGGIAHDFNNILGAILMYCDFIALKLDEPGAVRDGLKSIEKAAYRGAGLTKQLLVFSRKKLFETQTIHLNELLQEHFKMLNRLIGENITIEQNLEQSLPTIAADPSQIEQIIMNLAINARDAMKDGGRLLVETRFENLTEGFASAHLTSKMGPHVVLSISDNGCGMDEATRLQIFEPFFTTKPVGHGTGLGLSTVYGIVKSLNGTIWVYSEPGKGSVFRIYLPASSAPAPRPEEQEGPAQLSGTETVLIVEDELNLRELCSSVLENKGYRVLQAKNGLEALGLVDLHGISGKDHAGIDLIVTDMIMPEMGGGELVREIIKREAQVKVIYVSGYPDDKVGALDLESKQVAYLQKPFNADTLLKRVRGVLDAD
ncbi:MAG TPA: ATP-binding protein [Pseudobdellovibrionaceae bacterium]|nr:ATP-binding protein [Pseudobdellovibrionaceae bacterium]